MRRILIILFLAFAATGLIYLFLQTYLKVDTKVFLTNLKPPRKDIKQYLPQGAELKYPLSIPEGFRLGVFADLGTGKPRVLAFDSAETLLASVTNKGKVVALPDENDDGKADKIVDVLTGLNKPHGIALEDDKLYVAETNKVVKYTYDPRSFTATYPETLFSLPSGGRHFTRTIKVRDGRIYTSVGSSCDTCLEDNSQRAALLVSDLDGKNLRVFAKGLRNMVFFVFDKKGQIWGNDMGRDFLGDDLPPDELNIISENRDYGWPYCYGNQVRDIEFKTGEKGVYCLDTQPPVSNFPAHVAPLGLAFIDSNLFSPGEQGDLLVAYHGSWNRSEPVGYKIVKLTVFADSVAQAEDFITGWLTDGEVLGRPVDLVFDESGTLYISDDNAGLIYNLTKGL